MGRIPNGGQTSHRSGSRPDGRHVHADSDLRNDLDPQAWLDVVMNEDQDRTRLGNGPHNLAVLRRMALNAMQKEGSKGSLPGKIKRAGWEDELCLKF